jgi:hypothetical protein
MAALETHAEELRDNPHIPALAYAIIDHTRQHYFAEHQWLSGLIGSLNELYCLPGKTK